LDEKIGSLLKKEDALRKIATGYTTAEADHAYWLDLLSEVRGAFASDAVWITEFQPLVGYDPLAQTDGKTINGRPAVKNEFPTLSYGASALGDVKIEDASKKPRAKKETTAQVDASVINAIRIKGFWRENPKSQNVVTDLLKNLKDKPDGSFSFTAPGPKGSKVQLKDEQIMKITLTGEPGALAFPFEITLPLARPVAVK